MSIRRNRRRLHRHHRHRINVVLSLTPATLSYRQHLALLLLFRLLVARAFLPRSLARFARRRARPFSLLHVLPRRVPKPKHKLSVAVHLVVLVFDLAVAHQLPIEITALIADAARDFHRENAPLCVAKGSNAYSIVHSILRDELQKQRLVLLAPFSSRLRLARVVKTVVILIGVGFAVPEGFDASFAPAELAKHILGNLA